MALPKALHNRRKVICNIADHMNATSKSKSNDNREFSTSFGFNMNSAVRIILAFPDRYRSLIGSLDTADRVQLRPRILREALQCLANNQDPARARDLRKLCQTVEADMSPKIGETT
jgi:hypothetical protein